MHAGVARNGLRVAAVSLARPLRAVPQLLRHQWLVLARHPAAHPIGQLAQVEAVAQQLLHGVLGEGVAAPRALGPVAHIVQFDRNLAGRIARRAPLEGLQHPACFVVCRATPSAPMSVSGRRSGRGTAFTPSPRIAPNGRMPL